MIWGIQTNKPIITSTATTTTTRSQGARRTKKDRQTGRQAGGMCMIVSMYACI
jgi:hypothetical protein